jgi:hypothetical protein
MSIPGLINLLDLRFPILLKISTVVYIRRRIICCYENFSIFSWIGFVPIARTSY